MGRLIAKGDDAGCFMRVYIVYWKDPALGTWRCGDCFTPYQENAQRQAASLRKRGFDTNVIEHMIGKSVERLPHDVVKQEA